MEKDEFQKDLEDKKKTLQECQTTKNLKTCMDCEKIFECETRKNYVRATYDSMSKGETGGFEF
ncbi:hypothetical protein [Sulfurospirillum arcachonense]|uniref:hypothetical protein n=1 Tax=Sulfurospirillum arcachonense TaxID=57666 RepID=UPI0004BA8A0E|nr:hypothetical protein [Sulfurospirillum arcachonense]